MTLHIMPQLMCVCVCFIWMSSSMCLQRETLVHVYAMLTFQSCDIKINVESMIYMC